MFKKTGVKLELLTNNDMLMMFEKRIRGGIVHAIHRYTKANNKFIKNYNKNIESSYLIFRCKRFCMSKTMPVNGFKLKTTMYLYLMKTV